MVVENVARRPSLVRTPQGDTIPYDQAVQELCLGIKGNAPGLTPAIADKAIMDTYGRLNESYPSGGEFDACDPISASYVFLLARSILLFRPPQEVFDAARDIVAPA